MNLLRLRNSVVEWPYTLAQLRADEPQLSISSRPSDAELLALSTLTPPIYVYNVVPSPTPSIDPLSEYVVQIMPEFIGDQWVQRWSIESLPPPSPPEPNYRGFYNDLIADPVYQYISARAAFFQPLLAASTEFIAAFSDAKMGEPNPPAIQMTVWKLMYWLYPDNSAELSQFEVLKTSIQAILVNNHLHTIYTLEIPQPILDSFNSVPSPARFYKGVLSSNFYSQKLIPLVFSGITSVPGDATAIMGFAINDANSGLVGTPNPGGPPNSFQSALWLWMEAVGGFLDQTDIEEIENLLRLANLDQLYSLYRPVSP